MKDAVEIEGVRFIVLLHQYRGESGIELRMKIEAKEGGVNESFQMLLDDIPTNGSPVKGEVRIG